MSLPKRNSADGRCYWMKPEVQEELQPLFDQCIQDAIDGRITRLDSLWPPVVVSSEGAPFEVWQLLRTWTEAQRAETLDAEKAIAFSENLRRQSRWGEIDHHLLDMLQRELQEKYFIVTGNEDDHFWDREYSLKPGIRAEQVPEPLLRFACYVAVSYKVYGMDFQYALNEPDEDPGAQNRRSKGKNGPAPQCGGRHKQQSQQDAELGRGDGGAGGWGHKFVAAQLLHDESRHTHTNAGA